LKCALARRSGLFFCVCDPRSAPESLAIICNASPCPDVGPYSDPGYLRSGQVVKTHPASKNRAKRWGPKGWFAHAMFTPFQGVGAGAGASVPHSPAPGRTAMRAKGSPTSSKRSALVGWCHPLRRSGIMVTRRLFGFEASGLVRAEGLEPSRALRPNGFSYPSTAFAAPARLAAGFGVWTIPSPCPGCAPVVRCCPSSLYTFPTGKLIAPAGLGSGSPC
jgi:hypothetical protein